MTHLLLFFYWTGGSSPISIPVSVFAYIDVMPMTSMYLHIFFSFLRETIHRRPPHDLAERELARE